MGSCDTHVNIMWKNALKTFNKGEEAQLWHAAHLNFLFVINKPGAGKKKNMNCFNI